MAVGYNSDPFSLPYDSECGCLQAPGYAQARARGIGDTPAGKSDQGGNTASPNPDPNKKSDKDASIAPSDLLKKYNRGANPKSGVTILGNYPANKVKAGSITGGANWLDIDPDVWDSWSPATQRAVNKAFLDEAMLRGDRFLIEDPRGVLPGRDLEWELNYMRLFGFVRDSPNGGELINPNMSQ